MQGWRESIHSGFCSRRRMTFGLVTTGRRDAIAEWKTVELQSSQMWKTWGNGTTIDDHGACPTLLDPAESTEVSACLRRKFQLRLSVRCFYQVFYCSDSKITFDSLFCFLQETCLPQQKAKDRREGLRPKINRRCWMCLVPAVQMMRSEVKITLCLRQNPCPVWTSWLQQLNLQLEPQGGGVALWCRTLLHLCFPSQKQVRVFALFACYWDVLFWRHSVRSTITKVIPVF